MTNEVVVKSGLRFTAGTVSFRVVTEDPDEPGTWFVQPFIAGCFPSRKRSLGDRSRGTKMSTERILRLISEQNGNRMAYDLTTVGFRPGERSRHISACESDRKPLSFRWSHSRIMPSLPATT